jgi:PAS domain S-box-containing protein
MRQFDWASTPLGVPQNWPENLKTAVRIMLTSRQPIWIGWGPELTYFYNDPYKSIIGGKHPSALGRPTSEVWQEIWTDIGPMLSQAMGGLEGTYVEAQLLIMERNGYPEETYYTFSYSPIPNAAGKPGGIFCANSDDTQRVLGERQLALLREVATATAKARSWEQVWDHTAQALATNRRDLPFALFYEMDADGNNASLVGRSGIAADHPAALARLSLGLSATHPWATQPWAALPLTEVMAEHKARVVRDIGAAFEKPLPQGDWSRPPQDAIVLPITGSESGRGAFLICGLNPFRLFDDNYAGFLDLVAGQIASALANAEAYEQQRRRAEALANIDRAKTTFFSNVSHEFRTPLTLMLSPLEEVLAKPDEMDVEKRALVTVAHRNGMRLLKLVNSLLDFSRIESGKMQAQFEPVDLAAFTAELASAFRSVIEQAGVTLRVNASPLPKRVYVDRDMWEKIVFNLLSNAFKFTMAGEIIVDVTSANGCAQLTVKDTGSGIPPSDLPHLFERFHRVEGSGGRSIEGSGIGLALVQELLHLHGGRISVASEVGKGTAFTVTLPFGSHHLSSERVGENEQSSPSGARAAAYVQEAASWLAGDDVLPTASGSNDLAVMPAAPTAGGELVLLADDNRDMRAYVERLLVMAGYRVKTAANGEEALAAARVHKPALILSDVMMPGLDGFALLNKVHSDPELAHLPVILLSARAGEEARIEGLRAGADDYLSKPFSSQELLARVATNIHLAQARRETERLLQEETQVLTLLNQVGAVVSAELELERAVQVVTDTATQLSGAAFGSFFYNVVDSTGESYTLHSLSGAPREAFSQFPMPRNTKVFAPTFTGEEIVRSDDITKDPRFGQNDPYFGMPKGHLPVHSYLAVPVRSTSGEVLGGLFFGHPQPGVFDARAERIVAAIAVQAAIAIDKGRLYRAAQDEIERRRQVEAELRRSEQSLESKVAARTGELAAANASLLQAAAERERAEGNFQLLVEGVTDYAIFMLDPNGIVANWNTGAERIKGYHASDIVGQHFSRFYTEVDRAAGVPEAALKTAIETGHFQTEGVRVRKDGTTFWANVVINPVYNRAGALIGFTKITRDVTERIEAEQALERAQEQLAQAQKMEGIGQLTGGVAHDFNNLLTIIIGNLESVQRNFRTANVPERVGHSVDQAMRGAQRAASLTQRLLAFSRRQPLDPKPIDTGRLITGMSDLLRRTLGEQVSIETVLAGGLWRVLADPNQLEIAIINLAVNARDAMPDGGKLTIETVNTYLEDAYAAAQAEVSPGHYVVVSVTDTGSGMAADVMSRVFEPFFTTKDVGHGTGLGLSQVYGFVKQSGGNVKIFSEPNEGTTVRLYLPRLHSDEKQVVPTPVLAQPPHSSGGQTILLVEDENDVRAYSASALRELGYRVIEASNGAMALRLLQQRPEVVLLFTDIGLPGGMNGQQLSDRARDIRPDLKVLFTTGYARNAITHGGRLDPGTVLIPKPFTYANLATRLHELLDVKTGGWVLFVEDELLIQQLGVEYLEELGYCVEPAGSATAAVTKAKAKEGQFDAAIVDIGLPDRKGDALVGELRALYPQLPIIIASGYDDADLKRRFAGQANIGFVRKPYSRDDLRHAVNTARAP